MEKNVRILQLSESKESRYYLFASLELLEECGLKVNFDLYESVYEFKMDFQSESVDDDLESLYIKFQVSKPEGYTGHSLSVSDIIEVDGEKYYVDSFGFVKM